MGINYRSGTDGNDAFGCVFDNKAEEVPILSETSCVSAFCGKAGI